MAYEIGTANGHEDLLVKLKTFLTTGLGSQNWTLLEESSGEVGGIEGTTDKSYYYRAPGLAGTDQIYVVFTAFKNVGLDYYNIGIRGATGHNPADSYWNQPNTSKPTYMLLSNATLNYWFFANGRRVIIVARISTVYQHGHAGFFLPYGLPTEYPYPLLIGGSHYLHNQRWSVSAATDGYAHKAYWNGTRSTNSEGANASCYLREQGGYWRQLGNYTTSTDVAFDSSDNVFPWSSQDLTQSRQCYGSSDNYLLIPATLTSRKGGINTYGEIDGLFHVSGFNQESGNEIVIGGDTYLVFQNTFRSTREHYCAIKRA